jgi:outer membrane receptor protein involved in Fe transport
VFIDPVLVAISIVSEKVIVTADTVQTASVKSVMLERKMAETIIDNISAEDISRNPDGDAAGVLQRVTGISVVQDKFVYVRGLGERYSSTMLNGAQLPSTEPEKKVVAFDLFPSSLINKISTLKSYSPDQPADFSGALVKVDTVEFPSEFRLKYSASVGFNSNVTTKDYLDYRGARLDWLGAGMGVRRLPEIIPTDERVVKTNPITETGFTPEELSEYGRSFNNEWTPSDKKADPNFSQSFSGGGTFGNLGTVFSMTYGRKFQRQREVVNSYNELNGRLLPYNSFINDKNSETVKYGLVGNLSYRFSDDHKLLFKNFFSQDTSDEVRFLDGYSDANSADERNTRLRYIRERIFNTQASGEHYVIGDSLLQWRFSYSRARRDEPDMREMIYRSERDKDNFRWSPEGQSGFRQFTDQFDRVYEPGLDYNFFLLRPNVAASFKVGGLYQDRRRDFLSRRFVFLPFDRSIDMSQPAEELFASDNLVPGQIELREVTRFTDTYDATQKIYASYGMADITLAQKVRFIGGVRYERSDQFLTTFDPNAPQLEPRETRLDNRDALPSISAVYIMRPTMNLRASFSRTVNRPEFRELAPFQFTDISGRSTLFGNPDLRQTKINNFDARWEWFPSGVDLFAASFFHKKFDEPIERVLYWSADVLTSWFNVDEATNKGLELEVKKNLGFLSDGLENFSFYGNFSLIDSNVIIGEIPGVILTSQERPMQGQADYLFNSMLEYNNPAWLMHFRLLYNLVGNRITEVGANRQPDVIEQPNHFLDFSFAKRFNNFDRWQIKFTGQNLLNRAISHLQGDQIFYQYKLGRVFSIGLSYDIY